jgi:hypothetical protein
MQGHLVIIFRYYPKINYPCFMLVLMQKVQNLLADDFV